MAKGSARSRHCHSSFLASFLASFLGDATRVIRFIRRQTVGTYLNRPKTGAKFMPILAMKQSSRGRLRQAPGKAAVCAVSLRFRMSWMPMPRPMKTCLASGPYPRKPERWTGHCQRVRRYQEVHRLLRRHDEHLRSSRRRSQASGKGSGHFRRPVAGHSIASGHYRRKSL